MLPSPHPSKTRAQQAATKIIDIESILNSELSKMSTVQIEIPEEVLISLKETPETISRELRILAAVKLFEWNS